MARRRRHTRKRKSPRRSNTVHAPHAGDADRPLCGVRKYGDEIWIPRSVRPVDCLACVLHIHFGEVN